MTREADQARIPHDLRALIAIDLGAESCRVTLLRWISGRPVIGLVHRFPNAPRATAKGLRWDLAAIEAGINFGLRQAASLATEGVRSIAVDGWAVDYVHLSDRGLAAGDPYCYRDERTAAAEAMLHERIAPERMRTLTGVQLSRINTLYQLFADSPDTRNMPWLNLPEYILFRLGARPVAELTNASHSQLLDLTTRTWSEEVFAAASLPIECAPELVPPGTVIGNVSGALAQLPAFADTILIAPACHDTASAIAGIPASGNDWAYISSGTWSLVGRVLEVPHNGMESRGDNFTNLIAADGRTLFHKNINGMWLIRQCLEHWEGRDRKWSQEDLIAAAELVPEADELLDVDDPNLLLPGDMPGRINAQRTALGLRAMDAGADNAPAFAHLIYRSLAARYARVLARIAEQTRDPLHRIYIVGGGSQNSLLNRLTEAATGFEVIRAAIESSTIGNFAVQLANLERNACEKASGEIESWASALAPAMSPLG